MSEFAAWMLVLPVAAMLAWFTIEVLAGLRPFTLPAGDKDAELTIVIPAHDEAQGLAATLTDLASHFPAERILVVADNCSDATAATAAAAGVGVVERHDPQRPGKGHALAFARDALADRPPAAVMVLDADCRIAWGNPAALASRAVATGVPVQAENLQLAPDDASPMVRIGAFAFLLMNLVRARGLERIGGATFVQGTGTVYPWPVFARLRLASDNPVEDIETTLELARSGIATRIDPRCRVASTSPHRAGHLAQRRRWEHGSIRTIGSGVKLLGSGLGSRSRLRMATGAHYAVPPIAFLGLIVLASFLVTSAMAAAAISTWFPALVLAGAAMLAGMAIGVAWWFVGRETVSLGSLLLAPAYMVWKIPVYLGLLKGERAVWNRAPRSE